MALLSYATVTGDNQGKITDNDNTQDSMGTGNFQSSFANYATIYAYTNGIMVPTDPNTGQPSGSRIHVPATLTKAFSRSSPLLWQALCNGETLEIVLNNYVTNTTGQMQQNIQWTWKGCRLTDGKAWLPDVNDPTQVALPDLETWTFTFGEVTWEAPVAGTSGGDQWGAPNLA
jgi:type VI secretion system secreted protein Hcp